MISYHPVQFGNYRHCDSAGIIALICHVISQDHVTQEPYDILGWEPLMISHHPTKLYGQSHCGSADLMALVCHAIS